MTKPLRTKHTIEVEVEWQDGSEWHFLHGLGGGGSVYRSTEQLAAVGITKPPFEVGDLVASIHGAVYRVTKIADDCVWGTVVSAIPSGDLYRLDKKYLIKVGVAT